MGEVSLQRHPGPGAALGDGSARTHSVPESRQAFPPGLFYHSEASRGTEKSETSKWKGAGISDMVDGEQGSVRHSPETAAGSCRQAAGTEGRMGSLHTEARARAGAEASVLYLFCFYLLELLIHVKTHTSHSCVIYPFPHGLILYFCTVL